MTLTFESMLAALLDMAWDRANVAPKRLGPERLSPWQAKRVCDYLEDHIGDDVSLAELAALTGLSSHHLCRAFKAATGIAPHRYHIAARMQRARTLLSDCRLGVGDIAQIVGYHDPAYFSRIFRKETGRTPTAYRDEIR